MKTHHLAAPCRQYITPATLAQELEGVFTDHAPIHHPDTLGLAKTLLDGPDDLLDRLQILRVARQDEVRQRKTLAGDHQGYDHLLAVATVVAGVPALGQFVFLCQSFEVSTGEVVQQQIILQLKQDPELLLHVVFDAELCLHQVVECAIEPIFGDGTIRYAKQILQSGAGVPVLGQYVLKSSVASICRYQTATKHLESYVLQQPRPPQAHEIRADAFVAHLRSVDVAPNGHPNTKRGRLRDKGIRFILETCRAMYTFASKRRHLPPYTGNPFAELPLERLKIEDAKPIFTFDADTELAFFKAAAPWDFVIHFVFAKTGLRVGELAHLLIAEVDLDARWLHVRNKPELGWRIKTGHERDVPLLPEVVAALRGPWATAGLALCSFDANSPIAGCPCCTVAGKG